jgi:exodeoxyribonuclease V gamma subunit
MTAPIATHPPGFMVLHGNRLEDLRELLTQFLQAQPLAPLQAEVILVQSNGMKHWLELALADEAALGISAATRMELPGSYLWQVYRRVLGSEAVPAHMPFDKDSLVWRLVRLLPVLAAGDAVYAPLARYLGDRADGRRLYQLALQIADVLDGYQSYRADWLVDWAAGRPGGDLLRGHDGAALPLPGEHAWQAQLWRDLRADVGEALAEASRASVHARFMQALKDLVQHSLATGERPAGLPPRIVVFGISSLSMQTLEALAELGQLCQVLLLVQNPCQHYWGDIVEGHAQLRQQLRRRQQAKPLSAAAAAGDALHTATHPLLASWGKQGRDYLHLLDEFDRVENYRERLRRVDLFVDPALGEAPTQLKLLQSSLLNLQPLPEAPQALAEDGSITLKTAHSAQREVEVLHDQLLAWFDADAQLQPRDVMVMVPDMEAFAPHIQAVFGRFAPGQARHIPYSVADTTARQSPLVQALEQLLSLPLARVSLVDWLGLFEVSALRQRFGLSPADVAQLQDWLNLAGVRWGLDARHRQAWGLPAAVPGADQNTWAFGLRRLLLGYAVGGGDPWGETLPQAALGGLDAPLLGHLLDWIAAVDQTLAELAQPHTPEQWGQTLGAIVERFFLAGDEAEERHIQHLLEPLDVWLQACEEAALDETLPLEVVREHWLSQIQGSGLHQRFFGGGVQFGTLMPMRSIPFKAICLVGMNDGDYPRQMAPRDFDLMAQSWRAGDRSRREDDRYLFLEALLSARERLYISWQGHRATDNAEQPPSVLVAQLIDWLNANWTPERVPQQQPLQPYSQAYFLQGSAFSTYDADWAGAHGAAPSLGGAVATGQAIPMNPSLRGAVATRQSMAEDQQPGLLRSARNDDSCSPTTLSLDDLRLLLRQPVELFFRRRLRVTLDSLDEAQSEVEPFALNALERYQIGQDLLQAPAPAPALQRLALSGRLPMAAFGARSGEEFEQKLAVVLERRSPWQSQFSRPLPAQSVDLLLDGVTFTGSLQGLCASADGTGPWLQLESRLGAVLEGKGREQAARAHTVVGLWVRHLAANASAMPLVTVLLGLDGQVVLHPLQQDEARAILRRLLQAYGAAWARPLPVACKTAWAYLLAERKAQRLAVEKFGKEAPDPHDAAQLAFEGSQQRAGEWQESPYLSRAFDSYDAIADELPPWAQLLYGDLARHVRFSLEAGDAA